MAKDYEKLKQEIVAAMHDDTKCQKCLGSGKIANDDEQSAWPLWEAIEPPSNLMVQLGIVHPIDCPKCAGSGKA